MTSERLILLPRLGEVLSGGSAGLELQLGDLPRLERLAQRRLVGVERPVGVIEIPVRGLHVQEHVIDVLLELKALLIEVEPADQDAFVSETS